MLNVPHSSLLTSQEEKSRHIGQKGDALARYCADQFSPFFARYCAGGSFSPISPKFRHSYPFCVDIMLCMTIYFNM